MHVTRRWYTRNTPSGRSVQATQIHGRWYASGRWGGPLDRLQERYTRDGVIFETYDSGLTTALVPVEVK